MTQSPSARSVMIMLILNTEEAYNIFFNYWRCQEAGEVCEIIQVSFDCDNRYQIGIIGNPVGNGVEAEKEGVRHTTTTEQGDLRQESTYFDD